jgi:hypothetical protein
MKPSALQAALPRLLEDQVGVFLWGPPGVGKSDMIRRVAKETKAELRDVRLSLMDPIDLKGFPTIDTIKKEMHWLPANFLPKKGKTKSKGILFLDEMNAAPQSVQAAAYQLVLDRKLGDYELPDGWAIIAAGNRAGDRAVVHAQPSALANRFIHLDFDINNDDWNHWAQENDINLDIRSYMRAFPANLHNFDAAANPRAFPTPRSWSFVNRVYQQGYTADSEYEIIKGTIGEGAAAGFLAHVKNLHGMPTVDQVLLDPDGAKLPKNSSAQYAIIEALHTVTTVGNIARVMKYTARLPVEFQTIYVRAAIRRDEKLTGTKSYMDWGLKNSQVLM